MKEQINKVINNTIINNRIINNKIIKNKILKKKNLNNDKLHKVLPYKNGFKPNIHIYIDLRMGV